MGAFDFENNKVGLSAECEILVVMKNVSLHKRYLTN